MKALALLCCVNLAAADLAQLQQLSDRRQFFDLRRALARQSPPDPQTLFYRALVASRFGHEVESLDQFHAFLLANPSPAMARQAYEEMASALERLGRYRDAAHAWDSALRLTPAGDPQRAENENERALMDSLSAAAPTSAAAAREDTPVRGVRNRIGSWNVPVRVNGVDAEWIFDTGANFSTLAETGAKRMGLAIRKSKAYVNGSTAKKNPLQLAVADDVQLAGAHIHNVVFLVLADRALKIAPLNYQITGILGLPAIRALRRAEVSNTGEIRIGRRQTAAEETPNLFFDGESPIVEASHGGHGLQLFVDTGANETILYPSFRGALRPEELSRLHTKREQTAGAGGAIERQTEVIPALDLDVLGKSISLNNVSLLGEAPAAGDRHRDGVIGMDALSRGFVLDFDAMRLEVRE